MLLYKLPRQKWAKYVILGKMGDFGKVKTYQSNRTYGPLKHGHRLAICCITTLPTLRVVAWGIIQNDKNNCKCENPNAQKNNANRRCLFVCWFIQQRMQHIHNRFALLVRLQTPIQMN